MSCLAQGALNQASGRGSLGNWPDIYRAPENLDMTGLSVSGFPAKSDSLEVVGMEPPTQPPAKKLRSLMAGSHDEWETN